MPEHALKRLPNLAKQDTDMNSLIQKLYLKMQLIPKIKALNTDTFILCIAIRAKEGEVTYAIYNIDLLSNGTCVLAVSPSGVDEQVENMAEFHELLAYLNVGAAMPRTTTDQNTIYMQFMLHEKGTLTLIRGKTRVAVHNKSTLHALIKICPELYYTKHINSWPYRTVSI